MKAQEMQFLDIVGRPNVQFSVPAFQRVYSWTARECEDLIADVMHAGATNNAHFVGTFLYSTPDNSPDKISKLQVIDGQQRITTLTLMLMAFVEYLKTQGDAQAQRAQQLTKRFLLCDNGAQPKLLLTSIDEDMLAYLLGVQSEPEDIATRLVENLDLFRNKMLQPDFDENTFWRGCNLLQIIAIELTSEDSPQEVFESLNSKGKRLAIEDLVRNTILLGTSNKTGDEALALYENYWLPLEYKIADTKDITMEDVLCAWLAFHHEDVYLDSKSEVFPLFKADLTSKFNGDYKRLLVDLAAYADKLASSEQWRRNQLSEMDRWLQGKPKNIISERKMFGD
ncbi:DUF262 domain-containing protein [Adlercreutzia sp. ZJ304]|uniref:DUF262 domain-containing protein n=1 Tax=Adlercreutzia sp. ZJ304 TaxID=2709791 RepID=UPI0013EC89E3|nr:DUF262 domain-containing protein [Adlercreutzia sp. ZJ304]